MKKTSKGISGDPTKAAADIAAVKSRKRATTAKPVVSKYTCARCPLSYVNGGKPSYTNLILFEEKKRLRDNSKQKIVMILIGSPVDHKWLVPGKTQGLLRQWIKDYLQADKIYLVPVVKCVLPKDPTKPAIQCCEDILRQNIMQIKPDVYICLGKVAAVPFNISGRANEIYNRIYDVSPIKERDSVTGDYTGVETPPAKLIVTYPHEKFTEDVKYHSSVIATFRQASRILAGDSATTPERYYICENADEFGRWVDRHISDPRLNSLVHSYDIETNGRSIHPKTPFEAKFKPKLRCISFSWAKGTALCVPYEEDTDGYYPHIKRFMESGVPFIGHNVGFDLFFLRLVNGINTKNLVGDTMLMASMVNPGKGKYGYGLKPLAAEWTDLGGYETDMKGTPDIFDADGNVIETKWERVPMSVMAPYNCADADATLQIYKEFYQIFSKRNMFVAHWIMTHALIPLGEMEHNGMLVDRKWVDESRTKVEQIIERYKKDLIKFGDGNVYPWDSPKELGEVLYKILKYPVPQVESFQNDKDDYLSGKNENGNYPTGDAALSIINTPFTQTLRKYRKATKLLSTYFNGYLLNTCLDNRLRADFNLVGTVTGRLSSSGDANLQNIPSAMPHTAPGYAELHDFKIKKAFIPEPGWVMVNADQSQLELRIAGAISGEPGFINSYKNRIDMHSRNAMVSFSLNIDPRQWKEEALANGLVPGTEAYDVYIERAQCKYIKKHYPDERQAAKSVSFGILYGMSKWGLASDLNAKGRDAGSNKIWTPDECGNLIQRFKDGYPTLINWQNGLVKFAQRNGYTYTCFGRRRYLPLINGESYGDRAKASRHALNTPVQSAGSDFMMCGIINMDMRLNHKKFKFVATVHDSVVCEVYEDYVDEFIRISKECLEHPEINGKVLPLCNIMPFVAEFEVGDSYGTLQEYGK